MWHPFTHHGQWGTEAEPVVVIERAEGNTLIDTDGRRYLDAISSLWCNTLGHQVPAIDDAIRAQLGKVAHSTMLGLSSRPAVELAAKLADLCPGDLSRVFFSDAGATAVEIALKIAVQHSELVHGGKRKKILTLEDAYHGDTMGSVSLGYSSWFHRHFDHLKFDVGKLPCPYASKRLQGLELSAFERQLIDGAVKAIEDAGSELCAVVIEPLMQGAAGMIDQPSGYLKAVADATKRVGGLLIADEVATGFWRTGRRFACDHEDVTPDIMCLAKGLSGGYLPMAATLVTPQVFEPFAGGGPDGRNTFFHGHTFTGNALGCAASLAALDTLEAIAASGQIGQMIEALTYSIGHLNFHENVREIRQRGLMVGVELAQFDGAPYPKEARMGHRVAMHARSLGVLLRPLGDVLILMPPFSLSPAELEQAVDALIDSIEEVCGE